MKIIYNNLIPFGKRFYAINLFGVLFAKGPCDKTVINHEKIHTAQIREQFYLLFYIWYLLEWVVKLMLYKNSFKAYRNIYFEREAYLNQSDYQYLSHRKHFAFIHYIFKGA